MQFFNMGKIIITTKMLLGVFANTELEVPMGKNHTLFTCLA